MDHSGHARVETPSDRIKNKAMTAVPARVNENGLREVTGRPNRRIPVPVGCLRFGKGKIKTVDLP